MGAEGLMLPMVGSAAEARHILNSMKYTPEGGRGVALQVAHDRYRPGAVADKFAAANRRSTLFCQIETAEGVKNADAIAALPGVDCLWVGHFDLSVSLGVPGEFGSKKFTDAIARVAAAARQARQVAWAGWCPRSNRASSITRWASTSSAIRATSGCCTMRWRMRSASCARAARRRRPATRRPGRSHELALSRRPVRRFPQSRRLARLPRFRSRAAAPSPRRRGRLSRVHGPGSRPSSSPISMRSFC